MNLRLPFAALLVVSCGGSSPEPTSPGPASPAPAPSSTKPEPTAWKDMNHEQRAKFMGTVVMPKMKELFVGFDAKAYEGFSCRTCHGDGVADKSFSMPNPKLPVLPGSPEGFGVLMKDKPEVMKFMGTKVVPQMAQLLGETPFDPKNPQAGGFGCHECHTTKKP